MTASTDKRNCVHFRRLRRAGVLGSMVSALALSHAAQAQEADFVIEEIIVTAQNRAESIQDVPIAIAAYDENFIRATKLDDVKDLVDFTPGFAGKSKDSFVDTISIRGIVTNDFGVGGDPSIGIFKDGIHQGRNGSAVTSFFDIQRAEALRGPQGFLFGRNAVSGAISVIVNKPNPDEVEGLFRLGVAERDHIEGEAVVNLPLGSGWAVRAAGYYFHEDGYVDNFFNPNVPEAIRAEKGAGRLSLGYQGEKLSLTLIGEYENRDQSGSIYRAIEGDGVLEFFRELADNGDIPPFGNNGFLRGNGRDIDSDLLDDRDDGEIFSFTALIDYDFEWAVLSSITGVRTHNYHYREDFDGSPLQINNYFQDQEGEYFSQEFRLVSATDGPFSWFAGVSGYDENIDASFAQQGDEDLICLTFEEATCFDVFEGDFTYNPDGLVETNDVRGRYKGFGAYFDATYAFSDKFEFNAGIRYSYDEKDFGNRLNPVDSDLGPYFIFGYTSDGFVREERDWDQVTPRFTLRYYPNDDWTLWASVTKGYKSGGFGTFSLDLPTPEELGFSPEEIQACEDEELGIFCVVNEDGTVPEGTRPSAFNPETVWSYEVGTKANFFESRLQLDLNAYYYDYSDLQITFFDDDTLNTLVQNVGQVDGYGVEATMRARPDEHWDVLLTGAWSKTDISNVPDTICEGCDGNRLTQNPKWTFAGVATYRYPVGPGAVALGTEFRYQSSFHGGLDNLELTKVDKYVDVSLRAAYEADAGWEIAGYVENVFNALYYDGSGDGEAPIPSHFFGPSRPTTFGVDFIWRFGGQ